MYLQVDWGIRNWWFHRNLLQRQSNKHKGEIGTILSMFFLLMVLIVVMYQVYLWSVRQAADAVEDALVAAELSCAVIDIERFGRTHEVIIRSPEQAFQNFDQCLRENLAMDERGMSVRENLNGGPIRILDFRIYNVENTGTKEYRFDGSGSLIGITPMVEGCLTPNGVVVTTTAVYAKLGFYVDGLAESVIYAQKEKCVDITED